MPLRCDRCGEEIALAKRCPYCGATAPVERSEGAGKGRTRGRFRGRWVKGSASAGGPVTDNGEGRKSGSWQRLSPARKLGLVLAACYVLSPIDLLPGFALPFAGWLDDALVIMWVWRWIASGRGRRQTKIR